MPIYEYICNDCRERYELLVRTAGQTIACPKCSSPRHTLQLSVFNAAKAGSSSADFGTGSSAADFGTSACGCTPDTCGCN